MFVMIALRNLEKSTKSETVRSVVVEVLCVLDGKLERHTQPTSSRGTISHTIRTVELMQFV